MNILLIIGLAAFICMFIWLYMLFLSSTINDDKKPNTKKNIKESDVLAYCRELFNQDMHSQLQKYAARELSKNYSNVELRRILADSFMTSGNIRMAIAHYEAILAIQPYNTEIGELLANYYCENGLKAKAIDIWEQMLAYDSGCIKAVETLAFLYEEVKDFDNAIRMFQMMLDSEIDETGLGKLQYKLADLYVKAQDSKKAFEAYKKIYDLDSENLEILMIVADLAYKNKMWDECLEYCEKITSIIGDDIDIIERKAQINSIIENWDETISLYRKLISFEDIQNPNYFYHQNELCSALLKKGKFSEAVNILKNLLSVNPKETSIAFNLAQAYILDGEFQAGIDLYKDLLQELPKDQSKIIIKYISNSICSWAMDLFSKGQYNQAFDKFFEALKYDEENDEVYYQLGRCNYFIKSFQDSISHFKRAIAIKPEESRYYFSLGCAYDEIGMTKNAKTSFFDAINIDASNVKARIAYAVSLTKELEYAKSVEQFLLVLKQIPNDADTMYNVALAYELAGDIERASNYYRKALLADKNHKEAKHNLELLLGEKIEIENEPETEENNDTASGS